MKIGIITVHDSANFGSFLQAYALKEALLKMGHDIYFIKTRSRKDAFKVFLKGSKNIRKITFNTRKYYKFMKDINKFREMELTNLNENSLDVLIIGSDELWNVNTPVFRKECFYGIDIPVKKKITYAISSGSATYNEIKKYPNLIEGIKKLDKIFIRDDLTKSNVKSITGKECDFTCDPTFLMDVEYLKIKYDVLIKDKYILIYSYAFNDRQKEFIIKFAKKYSLKIVSAGLYNNWCDINLNCTPLEFSDVIRKSEYVITTTFHGTIFSILNKKDFITFEGSNKVKDVLERTGLTHRLFNTDKSFNEFEKNIMKKIDFDEAYKKILLLRKDSLKKLGEELQS